MPAIDLQIDQITMNASSPEDRTTALEAAITDLRNQGNIIRELKANSLQVDEVTGEGDAATKINRGAPHQRRIQSEVARLNELKQQHRGLVLAEIQRLMEQQATASTAPHDEQQTAERSIRDLENLLPSNEAKKLKKKRKEQLQKQRVAKERQFDVAQGTESVRCQRKIHNLLAHEGHDDTFRYFFRINPNVSNLKEGDPVYLTEKMDGTTMQATSQGVFKRFERRGARESGEDWHQLSENERYAVERVDLNNRAHRHIAQAVTPYLHMFEKLPDGVCIYFEAIGPHIGARFRDVALTHTIQVFDSSSVETGEFASFENTIALCQDVGLPMVAHRLTQLDLACTLDTLSKEPPYSHFEAPLEGFVVRPLGGSSAAAKIRVSDLPSIVDWER